VSSGSPLHDAHGRPSLGDELAALAAAATEQITGRDLADGSEETLGALHVATLTATMVGGLLQQISSRGVPLEGEALIACERLTRATLSIAPGLAELGPERTTRELELAAIDASCALQVGLTAAYTLFVGEAA
jgi:hypothetical protein